ncbi:MAG: leucine-rich repeat domain-containing protein [Treponema sp.]|nr:leucine-rich repeat domain-containing protein [Treponema sp.]
MKKRFPFVFFLFLGIPVFCQTFSDFEVKDRVLVKYRGRNTEVIIPESLGINRIGERAFAGNMVRLVRLPAGVDSIDNRAFAGCSMLREIFLPNTVSVIGYRAFFNCSVLEIINIPYSLRTIEDGAFFNCRSLRSLNLPDTLRSIGSRAFSGCTGFEALRLSRRTRIGEQAFMGVPRDKILYKD